MKLVSFRERNGNAYGVVTADGIVPVADDFAARYGSIRAVLAAGALAELEDWAGGRTATRALDAVTYLPPLHDAEKVICIGVNYPKRHPVDGEIPPPQHITVFSKLAGTIVGHEAPLLCPPPPAGDSFDYEGELVLVIGKEGRFIPKDAAFDHIAGYTILNDGSVRSFQKHSVAAGKNFFASSASGPWMVTADEIDDATRLTLSTRLNGEEVQRATVDQMIFDIPTQISYLSTFLHLKPGDIVSTGSPEGSGGSRIPQRFLRPGDRLEIEWSGIGTLRNHVADSADPA
ncbi:MAG: fumarylacetoacetate hydrolase family protein [Methyloligellaceae bacterium]